MEYRVRYHVRGTDSGEDCECLLQLWSSAARPATELKISSETGQFWHPLARLTAPITEAKYRQRRAREHDTGLERD